MKIEKITIDALAYGGAGVGRLADGRVCFAAGALPQEVVKIQITAEKKRFVIGKVLEVLAASPERIEPICPLAGKCPACAYMHCSYALETAWKDRQLRDFLLRNLPISADVIIPPFASPEFLHYRNKLVLHRDDAGNYGYIGSDNITVLPVKKCFLADRRINDLLWQANGKSALFRCIDTENQR